MLNLLLVDDEKLELEALRNYVNWKKFGVEKVYTAKNGKAALEIFLEEEIHIIITDIKMPVLDGITLAKTIYEMKTGAKIVFLSGYDDFEYLKAAMDVSAVDYIKKPFHISEIEKVFEKIKKKIEKDRLINRSLSVMENQLLEDICIRGSEAQESIEQAHKMHDEKGLVSAYGMIQVYGLFQHNIPEIIQGMMAEVEYGFVKGNKITFLIKNYVSFYDSAKRILDCTKKISGKECFAIYYEKKLAIEQLGAGYEILSSYEDVMFYEEVGDVFPVKEKAVLFQNKTDWNRMHELANSLVEIVKYCRF